MYNIVEPLIKTAARFTPGQSGSAVNGYSSEDIEGTFGNITSSSTPAPMKFSHPARRALIQREYGADDGFRSVSFDERAELQDVTRSSSSSLERVSESDLTSCGEGAASSSVTMDKISTMTLREFKSLLNSALSVPEDHQHSTTQSAPGSRGRSPGYSPADPSRPLNWDNVHEKARSVRDSLSSSVGARRAGSGANTSGVGRRSLPQSPDEDRGRPATALGVERPKTPKALRRNVDSSNATVISRPKTPTSLSRPKTPTRNLGYRPKTPSGSEKTGPKEEYRMSRPKTPSQLKRDAVAKVAGAISNWVESRNEMDASGPGANRPKTPTRPKTPVGSRRHLPQKSVDDYDDDDDDDDNMEVAGTLANAQVSNLVSAVRERPNTPSRIPKPCFTPRPSTPKAPSSLAIDNTREDPSPSTSVCHTPASQSGTVSTSKPSLISRSNSNCSSVKSAEENLPSPAGSHSDDKTFRSSIAQSKLANVATRSSNNANSNNASTGSTNNSSRSYKDIYTAKRSVTPGGTDSRVQPARAVTPGPREKWTIGGTGGGTSSARSTPGTQRRGSLTNTGQMDQPVSTRSAGPGANMRRTSSTSNLEPDQMTITNEITFSDDEEINELVKNAAMKAKQATVDKRSRSASVDARRLVRQNAKQNEEEVLMITRDSAGHHGIQMINKNEVKYESTPKPQVVRRPVSRGSSTERPTPAAAARFRSQTPEPFMFRQKLSTAKTKGSKEAESALSARGDKSMNRTEAWVDSTLSDTKRKLPPRPKRAKGFVNEVPACELEPRPLEEIQAMLAEPKNGFVQVDTEALDVPAEDPEMFKKMEKLFEKYREMELRASVNETPGGGGSGPVAGEKSADTLSGKGGSEGSGHAPSKSSQSVASVKTSSSGVSSGRGNSSSSRKPSTGEENRFTRSSSVPGSFHTQLRRSASNNSSTVNSPSQEKKDFPRQGSSGQEATTSYNGPTLAPTEEKKSPGSLRDIDPEVAKDPKALISKIKEILQVRPRKDENSKVRTRIPAPANLNKYSRSKSVSNLCSNGGEDDGGEDGSRSVRGVLHHTNSVPYYNNYNNNNNISNNNHNLRKGSSSSSGNIAYSEFVFTDEDAADEVPELSRTGSVQSDSSDSQNRSETPVPKLAMPLTTGRSTLISRKGERLGRGLSQDKENNLSNSQSSLSSRSVLSTTEDEADFV